MHVYAVAGNLRNQPEIIARITEGTTAAHYNQFLCAISVVALSPDQVDSAAEYKAVEMRFKDQLKSALKNKQGQALAVSQKTVNGVQ